jgi:hypothetical protein
MPRPTNLKKEDLVVENPVPEGSHLDTGYPFKLTDLQVLKLIYFFSARRAASKALGNASAVRDFTTDENSLLKTFFQWFGFSASNDIEKRAAYRAVTFKFRAVYNFLKSHPAYITPGIKQALEEGGYQAALKNIVMVVGEDGKIQPRVVSHGTEKRLPPIGQLDSLMWEFQNVALDKLRMIVDNITLKDVKKSNLGMKSKALRDMYAVIHMVRLGNKNPNLTLVNVNVNAEPKDKLAAYGAYLQKNREGEK